MNPQDNHRDGDSGMPDMVSWRETLSYILVAVRYIQRYRYARSRAIANINWIFPLSLPGVPDFHAHQVTGPQ